MSARRLLLCGAEPQWQHVELANITGGIASAAADLDGDGDIDLTGPNGYNRDRKKMWVHLNQSAAPPINGDG